MMLRHDLDLQTSHVASQLSMLHHIPRSSSYVVVAAGMSACAECQFMLVPSKPAIRQAMSSIEAVCVFCVMCLYQVLWLLQGPVQVVHRCQWIVHTYLC